VKKTVSKKGCESRKGEASERFWILFCEGMRGVRRPLNCGDWGGGGVHCRMLVGGEAPRNTAGVA
jgi:hypothetical protein